MHFTEVESFTHDNEVKLFNDHFVVQLEQSVDCVCVCVCVCVYGWVGVSVCTDNRFRTKRPLT